MNEKNSSDVRLNFRQRLDYGIYDMGYYFVNYWIMNFLTIFYTDVVGVSLSAVAALIFAVRIFDAVNDPIIGAMADRSKKGYGFWLKYGGIAFAICAFLLFAVRPSWPTGIKILWMWVIYFCVSITSTGCYMPYMALNGLLTSNPEERNKLSALRVFLQNVGGQVVGIIAVPLVTLLCGTSTGKEAINGYTISVAICAVIFCAMSVYTPGRIKVVVSKPESQKTMSVKEIFKTLIHNKYAVIALIGLFVHGMAQYGIGGVLTYYFQYVAGDLKLMSLYTTISLIACFIGSGLGTNLIYNLTRHKGRACILTWGIYALLVAPRFIVPASSPVFWILLLLSQIFCAAAGGLSYGMIGDIVDYGESVDGVRIDGVLSAAVSLALKAGGALGPAVVLLIVDAAGFVSNAAVQTPQANMALTAGVSLFPAVLSGIAVVAFCFYDLSEKRMAEIQEKIIMQRKNTEE